MRTGLIHALDRAFHPRGVAVVGASSNAGSFGYLFLRHLLHYGYRGGIYPVNPKEPSIQGVAAYPRITDVPGPVDYAVICVPAAAVPGVLQDCARAGVPVVHLFTGRLTETGRAQAREQEQEILRLSRGLGVRIIGPNCMGLYSPAEGISFGYELPQDPGPVGGVFQSGGASGEFVRYGALRGLRFSKVVSYGNALDVDESDLIDYLASDEETGIITAYIEGVHDGSKLVRSVGRASRVKPVIVLKGGGAGKGSARASFSHTASVAGSADVWRSAMRQTGAIPADSLEDMADLAVAFRFLPALLGKRVGVVGGGGGRSVLSAGECERAGLELPELPQAVRLELREMAPELWDWIGNPVDRSIMQGAAVDTGKVMNLLAARPEFDFIVANLTEDAPFDREGMVRLVRSESDDFIELHRRGAKPVAVIACQGELSGGDMDGWRWRLLAEQRESFISAGVPVFSTVGRAARSISRLVDYYQRRRLRDSSRRQRLST